MQVALNALGGLAIVSSPGGMAASLNSPQSQARTLLDLVIINFIKPMHPAQSEKQRIDAAIVTLDVIQHLFEIHPQIPFSRLDQKMFKILFSQALPDSDITLDPFEQLFIAAAFRQSKWVTEETVGDKDSLQDYDHYLSKEVQRLGPCEVSARLDESMLLADAHDNDPDSAVPRWLDHSILSNTVRTLKNRGMTVGPRAQQVLWSDEEQENQKRWEEAFPGYWHAYWTQEGQS